MNNPLTKNDGFWAACLLAPTMLGLLIFNIGPTLASFALSFHRWNLLGTPAWIGLENYTHLFADGRFGAAFANTAIYTVSCVSVEVMLAAVIAAGLNRAGRWQGLLRTAYYLPVVCSMVAIAIVWSWVFDPANGPMNAALRGFGGRPIAWLSDPHWALPSLILVGVWKNLGTDIVLILAGLQAVSPSLMEAADIDGASTFRRFWSVTLPLITPTLFLVSVLATINACQTFDSIYLLTHGGPGTSTLTLAYWLYESAFQYFNIGRATALAVILAGMIGLLVGVQWTFRRKWVYGE
ncbi:MAG: sugar ABC transporter permease [Candidatus Sericytochromatia bacterium]|nr:sugar ABC transporter permease [Candidatus Sericytochromatia bacterium]